MAKRWKKEDLTYLKRYAAKRSVAELAERFATDNDGVAEKLEELKVRSKDGFGYREPYVDPALADYEKGLKAYYGGSFADAKKLFEKVVETSDQADTAMRARNFLVACARKLDKVDESDLDPLTTAVMAKNRGDDEEALEMSKQGGRAGKDGRFAYLAASILAGRLEVPEASNDDADDEAEAGEDVAVEENAEQSAASDEAMAQLLKAIDLDSTNRVHAYHDSDFDSLRRREDFLELYADPEEELEEADGLDSVEGAEGGEFLPADGENSVEEELAS